MPGGLVARGSGRGCVRGYCQACVRSCSKTRQASKAAAAQQQSILYPMPLPTLHVWVMKCGACRESWQRFGRDVADAEKASMAAEKGFAFAFVEGALVRAVREGWWLLLDEINLAPAEVCSPAGVTNIGCSAGQLPKAYHPCTTTPFSSAA